MFLDGCFLSNRSDCLSRAGGGFSNCSASVHRGDPSFPRWRGLMQSASLRSVRSPAKFGRFCRSRAGGGGSISTDAKTEDESSFPSFGGGCIVDIMVASQFFLSRTSGGCSMAHHISEIENSCFLPFPVPSGVIPCVAKEQTIRGCSRRQRGYLF